MSWYILKEKVSENVVNYLTQEETTLPTIDNLVVLASVLGVRIDDILVMTGVQISMSV